MPRPVAIRWICPFLPPFTFASIAPSLLLCCVLVPDLALFLLVQAAAPKPAASPVAAGNRVLKDEFKKAVEVFEPPNLGLKDSRIKDAFTNLMFAIQ